MPFARSITVFIALLATVRGDAACPVSLSNPDGQALALEKYDLRIAVHGCLSMTEMEMVFRNPLPREMEGRFLYLLPPGAAISRFAKDVNGQLMEGEVVERMTAQTVFNQILPTLKDPALLETDQGNRFSVRVYPVPASGTVRLLLSYSQLIPLRNGERKLLIPIAGMPQIGEFNLRIAGNKLAGETAAGVLLDQPESFNADDLSATRHAANFTPLHDLELTFKPADAKDSEVVRAFAAGKFQMLCFKPEIPAPKTEPPRGWVFYFDTSASNADIDAWRQQAIAALLKQPEIKTARSWYFDLAVESGATDSPAAGLADSVLQTLRARHSLGATNLEAALKHLGEQARAEKSPQRYVLVSDGIPTIGARETPALLAALGPWPDRHVLSALAIGSKRDAVTLEGIVAKTNGRVVTLPLSADRIDMDRLAEAALSELRKPLGRSYEFRDEGAKTLCPRKFRDVQPGSELVVFAELKFPGASRTAVVVTRSAGEGPGPERILNVTAAPLQDFAVLIWREAARAQLDELQRLQEAEKNPERRASLQAERIRFSIVNHVLCPLTSLLVLESEYDFERYGIPRGVRQLLFVGKTGVEMEFFAETPEGKKAAERLKAAMKKAREAEAQAKAEDRNLMKELDEATKARDFAAPDVAETAPPKAVAPPKPEAEPRIGGTKVQVQAAAGSAASFNRPPSFGTMETSNDELKIGGVNAMPQPDKVAAPNAEAPTGELTEQAQADSSDGADWAKQAGAVPDEKELSGLREKLAAHPRDRLCRYALAAGLLKAEKWDELEVQAYDWLKFDPENPQVYELLGTCAVKHNDAKRALRCFTSPAELAPNRAALLARSGWLLLAAGNHEPATELFGLALLNRQDDCNLYRGLALSHWLKGDLEGAAKVFEDALKMHFDERYGDTTRVLHEELGYVLRAMAQKNKSKPDEAAKIQVRAAADKVDLAEKDALRVTLCWETDGNDIDLHVLDPKGGECWSGNTSTEAGLELYTSKWLVTGLGPKVIRAKTVTPGVYHIGAKCRVAGPMGATRGAVVILKPENGIVDPASITIAPFCLVPGLSPIQHVATVKF